MEERSAGVQLRVTRRTSFWLLLIAAGAGCGTGKPATYPVEGTVRFEDGELVTFGMVEFHQPAQKLSARGKIRSDGTFSMSTFEPGDGAVAGTHRVMVVQLLMPGTVGVPNRPHQAHIDPLYANFDTSQLEFTVDPAVENRYDITLKKAVKKGAK